MNTPTKDFQFDETSNFENESMMGVTNLEVYNTVYDIDHTNNKFRIFNHQLIHYVIANYIINPKRIDNDFNPQFFNESILK